MSNQDTNVPEVFIPEPGALHPATAAAWSVALVEAVSWIAPGEASRETAKIAVAGLLDTLDDLMRRRRTGPGEITEGQPLGDAELRQLIAAVRTERRVWRVKYGGNVLALETWASGVTLHATGKPPEEPAFAEAPDGVYVGPARQLVRPDEYVEAVFGDGSVFFRPGGPAGK